MTESAQRPRRFRFTLPAIIALLVVAGALIAWQYRRLDPGPKLDAHGAAVVEALRAVPAETWVQTMRYEALSLRAWLVDLMDRFAPELWNDILVADYPRQWRRVLALVDTPYKKREVTADPYASLEPKLRELMEFMHADFDWGDPPPAGWSEAFAKIHLPAADPAAIVRIEGMESGAVISVRARGLVALGTRTDGTVEFKTAGHPWDVGGVRAQQGTVGEARYRLYRAEAATPDGGTIGFSVLLPAGPRDGGSGRCRDSWSR